MEISTRPSFSLEHLAPGWGAVIMGTGVISALFSSLERNGIEPALTLALAQVFLVLAIAVAIPILGLMTARLVRYPKAVQEDLNNPVKGAMLVSYPGGILVLAVGFSRSGMVLFGAETARALTYIFAAVGGALALVVGLVFLTGVFAGGQLKPSVISGTWFVPPVVTIIVPTALAPLLVAPSRVANELIWLSWGFLGIGALLYLAIVAALFYRTTTEPLPPEHLAPSLAIGMGPAGLIGLDLFLLAEASLRVGIGSQALLEVAEVGGVMLWGFGMWWGIAAATMILRGYGTVAFGLGWWGFTFPLGAWVVAGVNIGFTVDSVVVTASSLVGAVILVFGWVIVSVKTIVAIRNHTMWAQ